MSKVKQYYKEKKVLVTGAAGSIGSDIIRVLLTCKPAVVRAFDNDESGLFDLGHDFQSEKIRLLHGDIRDKDRLQMALESIDIVFHAAALKHVGLCEQNPFEAIKTNVLGTQNLIDASLEEGVGKVIGISTDKAVDPINVMGATKLLAERLMLSATRYKGRKKTVFSCVRFGNVLASRGSVVPLFVSQIKNGGPVTITDPAMTRFAMRISEAVNLVLKAGYLTQGQEIFILKMPVIKITDLAEILIDELAPKFGFTPSKIKVKILGNKFREKISEELVTNDELPLLRERKDMYIVVFNGPKRAKNSISLKELKESIKTLNKSELKKLLKQNKTL